MKQHPTTRLDAALMAIVVATAVAVAMFADRESAARERWIRDWQIPQGLDSSLPNYRPRSMWPTWVHELGARLGRSNGDLSAGLAVMGAGLAVVAYRPRRPTRRARSGPGDVASAIALAYLTAWFVGDSLSDWLDPITRLPPGTTRGTGPPYSMYWFNFAWYHGEYVAWSVLAAWAYLLFTRQWRVPPTFHDRVGRWVGVGWLTTIAANGAVRAIYRL